MKKTTFQIQFCKGNLNLLSDFPKPVDLGPESYFSNFASTTVQMAPTLDGTKWKICTRPRAIQPPSLSTP
jgi:hypothetical protein